MQPRILHPPRRIQDDRVEGTLLRCSRLNWKVIFIRGTPPLSKCRIPALFSVAFFLLASMPPAFSQKEPASPVEDRRKALNALFEDYWEERLQGRSRVCFVPRRQALQRQAHRLLGEGRSTMSCSASRTF